MNEKVLLDTDIGSDIDDALCLAYLLAQSKCELIGITTVSGKAYERAKMADALCKVAKKEIPIFPGIEEPLSGTQKQKNALQEKALKNWKHREVFPMGKAIEFLRDMIHKNAGEITLLAIGPLTNIATLFNIYPEIPGLLKRLVLMAGHFKKKTKGIDLVEWNAVCDPLAADIVYKAHTGVHRSIGYDVTYKVRMSYNQVQKSFQAPLLKTVGDFAEIWFEQVDHILFHDPLAATTIFNSKVCSFQKGLVEVELNNPHLRGLTNWNPDAAIKPHEAALAVDVDLFFKEFFSVF
jgi:purine nucleosidase